MQVLIIRHAPAEDREEFARQGQPDDLRPLTNQGKAKMCKNVQGLQKIIPQIHRIVESPFVRARQTADLLAYAYPRARRQVLSALAPLGSETAILNYLRENANPTHTLALVGHEPDLGELATWLLSGQADIWMPLKKGSASLLRFDKEIEAGEAELGWLLTPRQLRQLAR